MKQISITRQQMVTGTPCKPEPIIPKKENTVPGMPVEATNRHCVELKLSRYI